MLDLSVRSNIAGIADVLSEAASNVSAAAIASSCFCCGRIAVRGHIMRTILAFRFGKQTEETAQQKEKINARNETIKRQKAAAEANRHRPPDAVTQRLRDGDV